MLLAALNLERSILRMIAFGIGRVDDEAAVETLASTKLLLANLVANRARDTIFSLAPFLAITIERKMEKTSPPRAVQLGFRNG